MGGPHTLSECGRYISSTITTDELYLNELGRFSGDILTETGRFNPIDKTTFDYFYDSSILVGSYITAQRVLVGVRSSSNVIGVLVHSSRLSVLGRVSSNLVGVSTTADRLVSILRSSINLTGILTSASRLSVFIRSAIPLVGVITSASRNIGISSSILVGVISTGIRNVGITSSSVIGMVVSASRISILSRLSTPLVGVLSTANRLTEIFRSSTASQWFSAVLGEIGERFISISSTYFINDIGRFSSDKLSEIGRYNILREGYMILNIFIGVSTDTSTKSSNYFRDSGLQVGVIVSALRSVTLTSYILVGVLVTGIKNTSIHKISSILTGVSISASRLIEVYRESDNYVGVLVSASRLSQIVRSATNLIGVVVTAIFSIILGKDLKLSLSVYQPTNMDLSAQPYNKITILLEGGGEG